MAIDRRKSVNIVGAWAFSLAASSALSGTAQGQNRLGNISNNDSIFIEGKTFDVLGGKAKGDVAGQIKALGARELGGGAIIFRSGDKLYIAGGSMAGGSGGGPAIVSEGPIHIEYQEPKNAALKPGREQLLKNRRLETYRELPTP